MSQGNGDVEYVVGADESAALRMRAETLGTLERWTSISVGVAVFAPCLALLLVVGGGGWVSDATRLASVVVAAVVTPAGAIAARRGIEQARRFADAPGAGSVAMRLTGHGVRCGTDMAPDSIFLPWAVVTGARREDVRGLDLLILEVDPAPTGTPGVDGLDTPEVQRMLRPKPRGLGGIGFATSVLRRPVAEIDEALGRFTDGRVLVRQPA